MERKIGVYVCHCGSNIGGKVDVPKVVAFAGKLDSVVVAREYRFMCSDPGQDMIKQDVKQLGLNRVVVASCSPQMHEPTFRRVLLSAGLNPYLFEMANIREHASWVTEDSHKATEKAEALVSAAVRRVYHQEPLEIKEVPVNPDTLIVGGGIAGIQAALEIADADHKVYLVEREPSIGGHMIQLDKTFPTLDCSACILTPKMTAAGSHPNIQLLTYSEVIESSGYVGNFKVKVKKKPRYVIAKDCTGCGECSKVCPVSVPSEFDLSLVQRKAIYRPFPQAVPGAFVIDKRGKSPCAATCPAGVNAQGYVALISEGKFKEALEVVRRTMPFAGVCGRVCTHPCEAECERGKVDEPIAIRALKRFIADYELKVGKAKAEAITPTKTDRVAIVGSGPAGLACAYDLVGEGYPVTVFEAAPLAGGLLRYGIPEYRLPKKILDNEIDYMKEMGVDIKTSAPVTDIAQLKDHGFRAVFLATGLGASQKMDIPGEGAEGVVHAIDFLKRSASGQKISLGNAVAVTGGGNAAVDAARVALRLGAKQVSLIYRRSRAEMPAIPSEIEDMEREGVKITFLATPTRLLSRNGRLTGMQCVRMELGPPDESGRRRPIPIKDSEFEMAVDTVIIAIGQTIDGSMIPTPMDLTLTRQGTIFADAITCQTGIGGVFAGGDVVSGAGDVITAIASGKAAAVSINRYLRGADLKEERPKTIERVSNVDKKGVVKEPRVAMPAVDPARRIGSFAEVETGLEEQAAMNEARRCLNCAVCSECLECLKVCERKTIDHDMREETIELEVGNIIVATGFKVFDPTPMFKYGYGRLDNVITSMEFERMVNAAGPTVGRVLLKNGHEPRSVAIIHCVGSRDTNYHEYCSRVCCMYSMKFAHLVREHLPSTEVYEFYIDIRSPGKGFEEFYNRVLREGTIFYRGRPGEITDVAETTDEEGKLIVRFENTLVGKQLRLPVEMVVLGCGLEAQEDAREIARLFNISADASGFFIEKHPKLDPVATMTDGVLVAGCCQGPRDIPDTVAQASAAAARVLSLISKGKVQVEPTTAFINEESCSGCRICNALCPFGAISFIEGNRVSRVNDTLCKGCGACVAACPSSSITHRHFTDEQIMAEIEGILV